jgi:hypothetical protein
MDPINDKIIADDDFESCIDDDDSDYESCIDDE